MARALLGGGGSFGVGGCLLFFFAGSFEAVFLYVRVRLGLFGMATRGYVL